MSAAEEDQARAAMFDHLRRLCERHPAGVRSVDINAFSIEGRPQRLIVQAGIWKPAAFDAALTIRTTYTRPGDPAPYEDSVGSDGFLRYKFRGTDPEHSDNRALRAAMMRRAPLAYFEGIASGVYVAHFPVYVVAEDRSGLEFAIAVDEDQLLFEPDLVTEVQRRYVERLTRMRLHQPVFRARVLHAYATTCAMCRLRHGELLDAAHIRPDASSGSASVPNGLALCKIHHAAFDQQILGVQPDRLTVEVREDILRETDGPMLRHGLQEMKGVALLLPQSRAAHPDRTALEERYELFRRTA